MELKRGEMCWTFGTLYKKMDLKPSILKEISADVGWLGCVMSADVMVLV